MCHGTRNVRSVRANDALVGLAVWHISSGLFSDIQLCLRSGSNKPVKFSKYIHEISVFSVKYCGVLRELGWFQATTLTKLEIAAQGVAQCKVSATRVVVDAALRRIG